jgi:hypothetical protein
MNENNFLLNARVQKKLHLIFTTSIILSCFFINLPTAWLTFSILLIISMFFLTGNFAERFKKIINHPGGISVICLFFLFVGGTLYSNASWDIKLEFLIKYSKILLVPILICSVNSEKIRSYSINFFILRNNNTNIILYISSLYLIFFYLFDFLNNIKYAIFFKNTFLYLFVVSLAYSFVTEKQKLKITLFLLLFILIMIIEASSSSIFFSIFTLLCFIFCLFFLNKKKLAIFALLFLFFLTFIFQFSKYHQRLQLSKTNPKNNYEIFSLT